MPDAKPLLQAYGPWALITGAAGGLGAEFAEQIAAAGLNLALVDIESAQLESCCTGLRGRHGVAVRAIALDL
jgi:short-subunit dehydrogenase